MAACLADSGHFVTNFDVDPSVVEAINDGLTPIEPGLNDLVAKHAGEGLRATTIMTPSKRPM